MHYSLTNTPTTFQWFMNDIFKDLLDVCVVVYLDDILIYSEDQSEHEKHVHQVLQWLWDNNLFAKLEKCKFDVNTTNFLGYIISPEGLRMDDLKVQVIQEWPVPRKVKDIQLFLGFANFYHCFIVNYSDVTIPLMHLTCKNSAWNWLSSCQEAFTLLKKVFTTALILCHFDPSMPPIIETDALDYAIMGVFLLCAEDGNVLPITFYSHTLTGVELNYDTHDKELLAIFNAFKTWHHYLELPHHTINVVTNHKNLEYFFSTKVLSC